MPLNEQMERLEIATSRNVEILDSGSFFQRKVKEMCCICHGKKYLVTQRGDGMPAVERCNNCFKVEHLFSDVIASKFARLDGIIATPHYPCFIICRHPPQ